MKLLRKMKDGGPKSKVWGWFLIEIKSLFSVVLLRFENGSREAYHSHAFNAVSWVLSGRLEEDRQSFGTSVFKPSWRYIITSRDNMHKVTSRGTTWVLSFRGPWASTWQEIDETGKLITLTHGRRAA